MSDVIKSFSNEVVLAGKLAELDEPRYGKDKNGREYVSVRGAIQCGEDGVFLRRFESYINATKKDGTDSKLYNTMVNWLNEAVPMTKDKENATMVELRGSVQDNPYVSSKEDLIEGTRYSMQFVNDFTEYKCELNLEGYIKKPVPEIVNDEETGRYRTEIISTDSFRNVIDIKNIIIPKDMVEDFNDSGYEEGGVVGTLYLSYMPSKVAKTPAKGGFGKQRTDGQAHLELILVGGSTPVELEEEDSDNPDVVSIPMIKRMNVARKERLQEIKDAGYQGSKNSGGSARKAGFASKSSSSKTSSKAKKVVEDDDDDMPF